MGVADRIIKHIAENNMSFAEVARMAGMSRQNFADKVSGRDIRFNSATRILGGLGYQFRLKKTSGGAVEFPERPFFETAAKENLSYDAVERILESIGYTIDISSGELTAEAKN